MLRFLMQPRSEGVGRFCDRGFCVVISHKTQISPPRERQLRFAMLLRDASSTTVRTPSCPFINEGCATALSDMSEVHEFVPSPFSTFVMTRSEKDGTKISKKKGFLILDFDLRINLPPYGS